MAFSIHFSGEYLSIKNFQAWEGIEGLTVLTGPNGSGKSQLLRLLDAKFNPNGRNGKKEPLKSAASRLTITGETFAPGEVLLLEPQHALGDSGQIAAQASHDSLQGMFQDIQAGGHNYYQLENTETTRMRRRIIESLTAKGHNPKTITLDQFENIVEYDWFIGDLTQAFQGLGVAFKRYHADLLYKVNNKKLTLDEAEKDWNENSPWAQVSNLLAQTRLGISIANCWTDRVDRPYRILFQNREGKDISPIDLSTGEKVIVKLVIMSFLYRQQNSSPRLLLLDEQDAHLEPSAIVDYIRVLREVFVENAKAHVILTTHRSETLALVPSESIFELAKEPSRISKTTPNSAISKLSRNLLSVWTQGRVVLVEAEDDEKFYSELDRKLFPPSESGLTFVSVGNKKRSGGSSIVESHVVKMKGFALGLLDGDNKKSTTENIFQIERYSMENYYLDPPILASLLIQKGKLNAKDVGVVSLPGGGCLSEVSNMPEADLQLIADWIASKAFPFVAQSIVGTSTLIECEYINGKKLKLPEWFLLTRGHDMISAFQKAFALPILSVTTLHEHLVFQSMLPVEMKSKLATLKVAL